MGFFGNVKTAAIKTKLNGEIAMIDSEINTRKKTFGIELFDLIIKNDKASSNNDDAIVQPTMPTIFSSVESDMKPILDPCRFDIQKIEKKIEANAHEANHIKERGVAHQSAEAATTSAKAKKAGQWVSDGSKGTTKEMQKSMLKSKIKARKQTFGVDVWDTVAAPKQTGSKELSGVDQEIYDCIQAAKHDVSKIVDRRVIKKQAIMDL